MSEKQNSALTFKDSRQLERLIRALSDPGIRVAAIDGGCAAGKSTLAAILAERLNAIVVHTDDFYYPRNLPRGPFDGNSDLQRIKEEVLIPFLKQGSFTYTPFLPVQQKLGDPVYQQGKLLILEGSYSMHPILSGLIDYSVFIDVDERTQQKRLQKRSPELLERFNTVWIPDTKRYFEHYRIIDKADLILDSGI